MYFAQSEPGKLLTCQCRQDPGIFVFIPKVQLASRVITFFDSILQTNSAASGKVRRGAEGRPCQIPVLINRRSSLLRLFLINNRLIRKQVNLSVDSFLLSKIH